MNSPNSPAPCSTACSQIHLTESGLTHLATKLRSPITTMTVTELGSILSRLWPRNPPEFVNPLHMLMCSATYEGLQNFHIVLPLLGGKYGIGLSFGTKEIRAHSLDLTMAQGAPTKLFSLHHSETGPLSRSDMMCLYTALGIKTSMLPRSLSISIANSYHVPWNQGNVSSTPLQVVEQSSRLLMQRYAQQLVSSSRWITPR